MAARELTAVVVMGGEVYGPGYINPPPDVIAQAITNPACWGEETSDSDDDSPQGGEPETPQDPEPSGPAVPTEPTPTEPEPTSPTLPVPPRSGAGSGIGAWRAFADSRKVQYPANASRDDIIQACAQAKVI